MTGYPDTDAGLLIGVCKHSRHAGLVKGLGKHAGLVRGLGRHAGLVRGLNRLIKDAGLVKGQKTFLALVGYARRLVYRVQMPGGKFAGFLVKANIRLDRLGQGGYTLLFNHLV